MEKIKTIWFDAGRIYMKTQEGKVYSRPLEAYPELKDATVEQRNDYSIGDDGEDIRWEPNQVRSKYSRYVRSCINLARNY